MLNMAYSNAENVTNDEISIDFKTYQNQNFLGRISAWNQNSTSNIGGFKFYTVPSAGTLSATPAMTIQGSGNVGIGTTAPGNRKLAISGAGSTPSLNVDSVGLLSLDDGALTRLVFNIDSDSPYTASIQHKHYSADGNYYPVSINPLGGAFDVGGNKLVVTTAGNVGIGTTGPTGILHIGSDLSKKIVLGRYSAGAPSVIFTTAEDGTHYQFQNNNGNVVLGIKDTGTQGGVTIGGTSFGATPPDGGLLIDGNVGIGTTAPGTALHINSTAQSLYLARTGSAASEANIIFSTNGGDTGQIRGINGGGIRFTNNTSATEWVRISTAGNVGIGTTAPGAKLDIQSTTGDWTMKLNNYQWDGKGLYIYNDAANVTDTSPILQTATEEHGTGLYVQMNGNVGIGTTGPGAGLDVVKTAISNTLLGRFTTTGMSNDWNAHLTIGNEASNNNAFNLVYRHNTSAELRYLNIRPYEASNGVGLVVNASGNVGIGTTAPLAKLHVLMSDSGTSGPTATNSIFVGNSNATVNNFSGIYFSQTTGDGGGAIGAIHTDRAAGLRDSDLAFYTYLDNSLSERVRIKANGNVGIGTTGPGVKLHIQTTGANDAIAIIGTSASYASGNSAELAFKPSTEYSAANWPRLVSYNDGLGTYSAGFKFDVFKFPTGRETAVTIQSSGNVGIGTTGPLGKLHVQISSTDKFYTVGNNDGIILTNPSQTIGLSTYSGENYGGGTYMKLDGTANQSIKFTTNGTNNVVINSTGNVGIGTTNPLYKLDVKS
ncbi:hypothetical protein COY32_02075, partial [candidate division WWE3 bacterium CG_4_10_14_0_2_um_filter_41_14]